MLKQRMYCLVPYNISGRQAGIQALHAVVEYGLKYFLKPEYQQWANIEKTFIMLDGGTSNQQGKDYYSGLEYSGSMDKHLAYLTDLEIPCVPFFEPDLNNMMSAIAFLVDERVWDKENYPDYLQGIDPDETEQDYLMRIIGDENIIRLRAFLHPRNMRLASN